MMAHESVKPNLRKAHSVRTLIEERFHDGAYRGRHCVAILDMLVFVCRENPTQALRKIPNVRSGRGYWVKNPREKGRYKRVHWFRRTDSKMKFCLYSEPIHGWLSPYKLTLYADDRTGLLQHEVFNLLEVMPNTKLLFVELALDFSAFTNVTEHYVLRHALFGKSLRDFSTSNPAGDWWGTKKGKKRVKSYYKHLIHGHRVEFMLRRAFLEAHGIDTVFDLWKLADLLPIKHVLFARIDAERLIKALHREHTFWDSLQTAKQMFALEGDLGAQLLFLRQSVELKNTRRLLVRLQSNRLVTQALERWAATWPKVPARLAG